MSAPARLRLPSTTPLRRTLALLRRAAAWILLGAAVSTCRDEPTGPGGRTLRSADLAFAPVYPADVSLEGAALQVDRVRLRLARLDGTVAFDTLIDFPLDRDTLTIAATVNVVGTSESFAALLQLRAGELVLFADSAQVSAAANGIGSTPGAPIRLLLTYVGPGAGEVAALDLTPGDTALVLGDSARLAPHPTRTDGSAVPEVLLIWSSSDTATLRVSQAGVVTARRRGEAFVRVRTPEGIADSVRLAVIAAPASLVTTDSLLVDGEAGTVSRPLRVRVADASGAPVAGASVRFTATAGTLLADAVIADTAGVAATTLTLPTTAGASRVVARVGRVADSVTFAVTTRAAPLDTLRLDPETVAFASLGDTLTLVPHAADRFGNTVVPAEIAWTSSDTTVASVTAGGRILARANGAAVVRAAAGGRIDSASVTIAQQAAAFERPADADLHDSAHVAADAPVRVRLTDALGAPIVGAPVTWSVSGAAPVPESVTDSTGTAQALVTMPQLPTTVQVVARSTARPGDSVLVALAALAPDTFAIVPAALPPGEAYTVTLGDSIPVQAIIAGITGLPFRRPDVTFAASAPAVLGMRTEVLDPAQPLTQAWATALAGGESWVTVRGGGRADSALVRVVRLPHALVLAGDSLLTGVGGDTVGDVAATVRDRNGDALAGVTVTFEGRDGVQPLLPSAVTGTDGTARTAAVLPLFAGTGSVVARVAGLADSVVVRTEITASVVDTVRFDADSVVATAIGDTVGSVITLLDRDGNVVSGLADSVARVVLDTAVASLAGDQVVARAPGRTALVATAFGRADTLGVVVDQVVASVATVGDSARSVVAGHPVDSITVTVTDRRLVPIAGEGVTFRATAGAPADTVVVTGSDGRATLPLRLPTTVGELTVDAFVAGRPDTARVAITIVAGAADTVAWLADSLRFTALGERAVPAVRATDAYGNVLSTGGAVRSVIPTGVVSLLGDTVVAAGNGTAALVVTLDARADTIPVTVQQVVAAWAFTGDSTVAAGDSIAFSATATDALGNGVAGLAVGFAATRGTIPASVSTDAAGTALAWLLAPTSSDSGLAVTVRATPTDSATYAVAVVAGTATQLASALPVDGFASAGDTARVALAAFDAYGNPAALPTPVSFVTLDPAVATVDSAGLVTSIGDGTARIVSTAGTLTDTLSVQVNRIAAAWAVALPPDSIAAGAVSDSIRVRILDARGIGIPGRLVTFATSAGTLSVASALTDWAGDAITLLSAPTQADTSGTVVASHEALADSVRWTFRVVAGPAAVLDVAGDTVTFAAVGDTAAPRTVTAADAYGNPVSLDGLGWEVRDTTVARVDSTGRTWSVGGGSTWLVARLAGIADSVPVVVNQTISALRIERANGSTEPIALTALGDTVSVRTVTLDRNGNVIATVVPSWSLSPTGLVDTVSVGSSLRLTQIATGTLFLNAYYQGYYAADTIAVTQEVATINVYPVEARLSAGDSVQLYGEPVDKFGNPVDAGVRWSVRNPAQGSVDSFGFAKAAVSADSLVVVATSTVDSTEVERVIRLRPAQTYTSCSALPAEKTVISGPAAELWSQTTWPKGGAPYVLEDTVNVNYYELTVAPGVLVCGTPLRPIVVNGGRLVAEGTASDSVRFSSATGWEGIAFSGVPFNEVASRLSYAAVEVPGDRALYTTGSHSLVVRQSRVAGNGNALQVLDSYTTVRVDSARLSAVNYNALAATGPGITQVTGSVLQGGSVGAYVGSGADVRFLNDSVIGAGSHGLQVANGAVKASVDGLVITGTQTGAAALVEADVADTTFVLAGAGLQLRGNLSVALSAPYSLVARQFGADSVQGTLTGNTGTIGDVVELTKPFTTPAGLPSWSLSKAIRWRFTAPEGTYLFQPELRSQTGMTVQPGTRIEMADRARLTFVGYTLRAEGTATDSIRFAGLGGARWGGITLDGSNASGDSSRIAFAVIDSAGGTLQGADGPYALFTSSSASLALSDTRVANALGNGVLLYSTMAPRVSRLQVSNVGGTGLAVYSPYTSIVESRIENAGADGIVVAAAGVALVQDTVVGGAGAGIRLASGADSAFLSGLLVRDVQGTGLWVAPTATVTPESQFVRLANITSNAGEATYYGGLGAFLRLWEDSASQNELVGQVNAGNDVTITGWGAQGALAQFGTIHARGDLPWRITDTLRINEGQVLQAGEGWKLRAEAEAALVFDTTGRMIARGSPFNPIVLEAADPAQGWQGITLSGNPYYEPTIMRNVIVSHVQRANGAAIEAYEYHQVDLDSVLVRQAGSVEKQILTNGIGLFASFGGTSTVRRVVVDTVTGTAIVSGAGTYTVMDTVTTRGSGDALNVQGTLMGPNDVPALRGSSFLDWRNFGILLQGSAFVSQYSIETVQFGEPKDGDLRVYNASQYPVTIGDSYWGLGVTPTAGVHYEGAVEPVSNRSSSFTPFTLPFNIDLSGTL